MQSKIRCYISAWMFLVLLGTIHSFCTADLIVDLDAGNLPYGYVNTWPNAGTLGGFFTSSGNPKVEDVDGRKSVTFDGNDNFVSTFSVPDEITGNNSYTVAVWAYNPSIANEECMVNWAKRGTTSRCAQLNYGTNPLFGAVTHWAGDDMGFDSDVPASGQWHHIAVTYQGGSGSLETVYVNGQRNAIEYKTLNLWPNGVFYLGCSIESNERTRVLWFSGSIARIQVYDTALSETQIQALAFPFTLEETEGSTVVSEAGASDTYQIVLRARPSSNVIVTVTQDGRTLTNPASLTFTNSNWNTPQTVTVSAVDNLIIQGAQTSVLTHAVSSGDPTFDGLCVELGVLVLDNDRLGDFSSDGDVSFDDLLFFAQEWASDCTPGDFCSGTDLTGLTGKTGEPGRTDLYDLSVFSSLWQQGPILITEFMASNDNSFVTTANGLEADPDWIELYNAGPVDMDLDGWYLTDDLTVLNKWRFPSVVLESGRYLVVFASGQTTTPYVDALGYLHTTFSLDANGEDLAIVRPDGQIISHAWRSFPEQKTNYSYGLELQTLETGYFETPTPEATNGYSFDGFVADTQFSQNRGFYTTSFDVAVTTETPNAVIRYTTDGSMPTETNGSIYTEPVTISKTTCLRAAAFKEDLIPTNIDTQTYLFLDDIINQSATAPSAGWPATGYYNGQRFDYEMDPDVTTDPAYADFMDDALLQIPSISLVTDINNLFHDTYGIYVHACNKGDDWERPVSVELINPDDSEGFHINAGLRMRGQASCGGGNPKHAFRLFFRAKYGDSKLRFPLFGDEGADSFDKVDLRCEQNYSWSKDGDDWFGGQNTLIKDVFSRDLQREMGQPYNRSRYYHLYLNGVYWGVYQSEERADAKYGVSNFGGDSYDYDAVKTNSAWPRKIEVTDGTIDSYQRLHDAASAGFAADVDYYRVQGLNTDGTINPAYERLCDVDNVIVYLLSTYYIGDIDGPVTQWYGNGCANNIFAIYNKRNPDGYKFFKHDAEHSCQSHLLDDFTSDPYAVFSGAMDRTGPWNTGQYLEDFNPQWLHQQLMAHSEYRLRFTDIAHKHLFNNGVLTPAGAEALFMSRASEIDMAIIAESARWGDAQSNPARTKNDDWLVVLDKLGNEFFPVRTQQIIDQLIAKGLYPDVAAPIFNINGSYQHGEVITPPALLTMSAPEGTIYYTLDGSDPRQRLTGNAVGTVYSGAITLNHAALVKARVLSDDVWSALNDAVYDTVFAKDNLRVTEIMYHPADPNHEFVELKNIGDKAINLNLVQFTRGIHHTFGDIEVAPGGFALLVRNKTAFDNFYLNIPPGVPVIQWQDGALHNDEDQIQFNDAIGQSIQRFTYKDSWYPLTDGNGFSLTIVDPAVDPVLWNQKQNWRPSTTVGGSPGNDEIGLAPGAVVINEILAHSHDTLPDWIELHNTTGHSISIGGWFLSDDDLNLTLYTLPAETEIPAGGYVVLYEDAHFGDAFALSENGEALYLTSGAGGRITGYQTSQDYDASERDVTLGRYITSTGNMDFVALSSATPLAANAYPAVGPIVVSEIQYNPALGNNGGEYIELHNISDKTVCLENQSATETAPGVFEDQLISWSFTDGIDYVFPGGISIEPGEFLIIAENPSAFSAYYGSLPTSVRILGPFANETRLSNGGEKIRLCKPGEQLYGRQRSWIRMDQVHYDDELPWPTNPDGNGQSLQRIRVSDYGNDVANWQAAAPAPGQ